MSPPERRSRPAGNGPAAVIVGGDRVTSQTVHRDPDLVAQRRRWAYTLVRRAKGRPPRYGSAEWFALPEGSPERVASVVVAAEAYQRDGDDLEGVLRAQLEEQRRAFLERDDEQHRAAVVPLTRARVTTSFVERRRRQLADAQPRSGDYPGRHGDAS